MLSGSERNSGGQKLSDVLAQRGRLSEARCRLIGAQVSKALLALHDRGIVCGAVATNNLYVMPTGNVLIGSVVTKQDSNNTQASDDVARLAAVLAQCVCGIEIDPEASWSAAALTELGCGSEFADDLANLLANPSDPQGLTKLCANRKVDLQNDLAPTIDFEPTTITGLDPLPSSRAGVKQPSNPQQWQQRIQTELQKVRRMLKRR